MAYRECPNHGWLKTAEYAVSPNGEPICPVCETAVTGRYEDPGHRRSFGGPTHSPRQRFLDAHSEFMSRLDDVDDYYEVAPIMADFEFDA